MTPAHPGFVEAAQNYPNIVDFVTDHRNQNVTSKMLAPFHPAFNRMGPPLNPKAFVDSVLSYYDLIGAIAFWAVARRDDA